MNTIPKVVRLADVPPMHPKALEFWQMFEEMLVKKDLKRFDKYVDIDFQEYTQECPEAAEQLSKVYQYVKRKRVQWFS